MQKEKRSLYYNYPDSFNDFQYNQINEINLPSWYRWQQFTNDVYSMFLNEYNKRQRKRMITHRFGKPAYNLAREASKTANTTFVPEEWASYQRFYVIFKRTKLFKSLVDTNPNAAAATKRFFELIESMTEYNREIHGRWVSDMAEILQLLLMNSDEGLELLPFLQGGDEAGQAHYSLKNVSEKIMLFKVYKKLKIEFQWAREVVVDLEPSPWPEDTVEPEPIKELSDAAKLMPVSQYAIEDDLFYYKLATKELLKQQYYKYKAKSKRIIILVDVSGSMKGYKRYIVANAAVLAIADLAKESQVNEVTVIPFDNQPHEPIELPPDQLKRHILDNLLYSGGGTSIDNALRKADELKATDILLITDGQDEVTYKPKARLRTILLDQNETLENMSDELKKINPIELIRS